MKRRMLSRVISIFRDLWLILGVTLVMVLGLELLARIVLNLHINSNNERLVDLGLRADVYRNQDWADEYWREDDIAAFWFDSWSSYVYWRRNPLSGKYINIDQNGIRRTWNQTPTPSSNAVKIMMFGGSTLWGTGARDEFTIPSFVSKKLNAKNVDVWVTNMGEGGYVSTQEVIALMLELRKGNVPDLVVFYDGINDTDSAFQQGIAGIPLQENNRKAEFNQFNWRGGILEKSSLYWSVYMVVDYARFLAQPRQAPANLQAYANQELASSVLDTYVANMQIVESLAQSYAFPVVFYWQPVLSNKRNLSQFENRKFIRYGGIGLFQQMDRSLDQRSLAQSHSDFHDLRDAFDDHSETIFIDFFHISEAGNERIADLIIQTLPPLTPHTSTRLIPNP